MDRQVSGNGSRGRYIIIDRSNASDFQGADLDPLHCRGFWMADATPNLLAVAGVLSKDVEQIYYKMRAIGDESSPAFRKLRNEYLQHLKNNRGTVIKLTKEDLRRLS